MLKENSEIECLEKNFLDIINEQNKLFESPRFQINSKDIKELYDDSSQINIIIRIQTFHNDIIDEIDKIDNSLNSILENFSKNFQNDDFIRKGCSISFMIKDEDDSTVIGYINISDEFIYFSICENIIY